MTAPAKAIVIAMASTIILALIMQVFLFFPFYMTLVIETFNLANVAATDNYVKESFYDTIIEDLRDRPVFSRRPRNEVQIHVRNSDNQSAIGDDNEFYYDEYGIDDHLKPYRQRGEPITITIEARYPLEFQWMGMTFRHDAGIPVSFEMTTIGLRYYKDLDL